MTTAPVTFEFDAVDRAGARRRSTVAAATRAEAYRKVATMGLTPLTIRPAGGPGGPWRLMSRRIRTKELAQFTYQLGVLVQARIPISEGLVGVAQQEKDGRLREVVMDLAKRIQAGEQVAAAMEHHQDALGPVYVETVRAAERSGNLSKVLDHLSEMLERGQEQARMVRSALMYPACVVAVLALAVFFLVGFVVPKFAKMFQSRGLQLPVFTRLLMDLGLSVQGYWWAYLLGAAAASALAVWAHGRPAGRAALDAAVHRVPYIRDIIAGATISRFSSIFALSLQSGLGLIESLELAGRSAGRPSLQRDVQRMIGQVRSGGRLTEALAHCDYLTPFAKRMLVAGEQSAELPRMCAVVSRHYDRETAHLAKNLSTFVEPVLIVAIAGVVLVIALAIFLPMWDMAKLVG